MKRSLVVGVLLAALSACGRASHDAPTTAPAAEIESLTGWLEADGAGETAIVYRDAADAPGFSLSCARAAKSFRVMAPDPVEGAPIEKETATLILGDQAFLVPVAAGQGVEPTLVVETPMIPKLLRAVADAKSARLVFRDGFVETGVDTDGKFLDFSRRCETLTGVAAAP